jgi:imidazolonepropionase-like amidohydrolase
MASVDGDQVAGNSFVVRNVRVFDGERVHERVNVVVRDGRIAAIGEASPPRDLPVVDGTGRTLLPGLIDAHGHVSGEASLRDAIRFGVTTVLDMLTSTDVAQANRARRSQPERPDLAELYTSGTPVESPGGLTTQFGIPFSTISSPAEAPAFVRGRVADGSDFIKIIYEPSVPFFTSISRETLTAVIAAAHAEGVLGVVHVSSLEGARDAVAAGADVLAHGFADAHIDDALLQQMAARGTYVTPTLSIIAAFGGRGLGPALESDPRVSPYLTAAQRKVLTTPGPGPDYPLAPYLVRFEIDRASDNVRRMRSAGVRLLAGTDAPNLSAHGASLHGELELLTRAGLTPADALRAATLTPAQAFRLTDRGRIVPGARADLLLVEGNPLEDIELTRAIVRIFRNGVEVSRALPAAPSEGGRR